MQKWPGRLKRRPSRRGSTNTAPSLSAALLTHAPSSSDRRSRSGVRSSNHRARESTDRFRGDLRMYAEAIPYDAVFDYIVVGAGSAGCIVASRLSEDSDNQVLLIEAGGRDTSINTRIPVLVANILRD